MYGLEECTLIGAFEPCAEGIDCGLSYTELGEGGLALTYRYDDSDLLLVDVGLRRRLDESPGGRPEGCSSSFRVTLLPGTQAAPPNPVRLATGQQAELVVREAGANLAPDLGDTTGPCQDWVTDWPGLGAFSFVTDLPVDRSTPATTALATAVATALGLEGSDEGWMRGYGMLTGLALILAIVRSTTFVWLALSAARSMHDTMAATVLHAPMRFFEENPRGRILNRFVSDLDKVDTQLPTIAGDTLRLACTVLGAIGICLVLLPPLVIALLPCWVAFRHIQRYYLLSSREMARLEATARSPLYALFTASLHGLPTIRAAQLQQFFGAQFQVALERYHRPHWLGLAGRRWVAVRFDGVANVLITAAALLVLMLQGDGEGGLSGGMAGVALTQALQLVGMFQYAVRQAAETENLMTAVERVRAFALTRREGGPTSGDGGKTPPKGWPAAGRLQLERVVLRYRPELDPALESVSMVLNPGERIGIVGRSGAGKSSLFGAIFRLVEVESGRIVLDGVDVATIGLRKLRQVVGIIPQSPLLFSGTLRMNLDPSEAHRCGCVGPILDF